MPVKYGAGKSVSQENSIYSKLKEIIKTDTKVYYVMWKYAPQLFPNEFKTFNDLKSNYKVFTDGVTEHTAENWLSEQNVQTAIKWLLKRLHQQKMIELYNIYFEMAKKDVAAFKAFTDFSEKFFANEKESELLSMLGKIDIEEE